MRIVRGRLITFNGGCGIKSKPIPGPHQVYGFLTTSSNAFVEPIHAKAMPVILTMKSARSGCGRRCKTVAG